jgi:cytochrome c biogenesis protein CcmG/thiol:disulfide interchange protein DsbE
MKIIFQHWKPFSFLVLIVTAAWIWIAMLIQRNSTSSQISTPHEGFYAPVFTLPDTDNVDVSLVDLKGFPVIINFWATWCPPCRAEMPALQSVYQRYKDQGLVVLAVNTTYQDSIDKVSIFVSDNNLTFPILLDEMSQTSTDYQIRSLPTTFFIDKDGIIRDVVIGGPMSEALLYIRVEGLLIGDY